jgi:hypothetical protein
MRKEELCNRCVEGICDIHSGSEMAKIRKEYARLLVKENRREKQGRGRNGNGKAGGKPVKLRRPPAHLC